MALRRTESLTVISVMMRVKGEGSVSVGTRDPGGSRPGRQSLSDYSLRVS